MSFQSVWRQKPPVVFATTKKALRFFSRSAEKEHSRDVLPAAPPQWQDSLADSKHAVFNAEQDKHTTLD